MPGWGIALAHRVVGAGPGPVAGGSWPGGQPPSPSSQPAAPTASVDRPEATMPTPTRAPILSGGHDRAARAGPQPLSPASHSA